MGKTKSKSDTIFVKITSRAGVQLETEALSLTAVNQTGEFDILPRHHNFLSLLEPCVVKVRTSQSVEELEIQGGIIHVQSDKVSVFLDV